MTDSKRRATLEAIAYGADVDEARRLKALALLAELDRREPVRDSRTTAEVTADYATRLADDAERLQKAVALFAEHVMPSTEVFLEAVERRAEVRALELATQERARVQAVSKAKVEEAGSHMTTDPRSRSGQCPRAARCTRSSSTQPPSVSPAWRVGCTTFDPLLPGLELVRSGLTAEELTGLSTYPEIASSCAVLVFVAAVLGRTRFK